MQLLRDNLTLWTSSDGAEPEGAAAEASKEGEKPAETKAEEAPAAAAAPAEGAPAAQES